MLEYKYLLPVRISNRPDDLIDHENTNYRYLFRLNRELNKYLHKIFLTYRYKINLQELLPNENIYSYIKRYPDLFTLSNLCKDIEDIDLSVPLTDTDKKRIYPVVAFLLYYMNKSLFKSKEEIISGFIAKALIHHLIVTFYIRPNKIKEIIRSLYNGNTKNTLLILRTLRNAILDCQIQYKNIITNKNIDIYYSLTLSNEKLIKEFIT